MKSCCNLLLFLAVVLIIAGCAGNANKNNSDYGEPFKDLTLREKIGQVVCFCYNDDLIRQYGDGSIDTLIKRYPVGSVFMASWLMGGGMPADSMKPVYIRKIKAFVNASKTPLLFSEDFESGLGDAIPGFTSLPGEMALGAANSAELGFEYGDILARQARSIGINWLLNPVSDLNKNPFNYLTNSRATGDDPNRAIRVLPPRVRAMQKQKVAATSKHFPGDGTGYTNQHFSITPMNLSYKKWTHQHGRVFQTMIDSGVMCIMAGHISFPDYEKNLTDAGYLPATLSDELMTKLLKNEMGFKGVVVSDALNMAGIHTYYPTQLETEIACFKAGADVLLWPRLEIIDTIEARINRGEIPMERLNDALGRIWRMKKQLGVFEKDYQYVQPISDEQLKKDNETAYEIASKAVTVIENKKQMIPLDTATSKNILVVYISANDLTERFKPMVDQLKSQGFKVDTRHNLSWFLYARMVDSIAVNYQKVIVVFNQTPGNPWGTLGLSGDEALSTWSVNMLPLSQVISIGFGDPYKNFIDMPRIWCRINVYNADQNSQKAVVDVLTGKIKATATSPVTYN